MLIHQVREDATFILHQSYFWHPEFLSSAHLHTHSISPTCFETILWEDLLHTETGGPTHTKTQLSKTVNIKE